MSFPEPPDQAMPIDKPQAIRTLPQSRTRPAWGCIAWGVDIGTEYSLFDAGLDRFVQCDKPDFVGPWVMGETYTICDP